ncbi:MAG TPA: hypothetical protein VGG28_09440 [Kofleriaceae bacterium]
MTFRSFAPVLVVGLALIGCGDNLKPSIDASEGFVEALPGSGVIPQVINSGGPVLASAIVQPIFFAMGSDTAITEPYVEAFLPQLATSDYWNAVGSEYGVGPMTIMPSIISTDPIPETQADLETYLTAQLDGTHAGWPLADLTSTIYMVQLQAGTAFAGACTEFAGFHEDTSAGLTYAVIANCGAAPTINATALDEVTDAISHELIEAATDPKPSTNGAYVSTDDAHLAWSREAGAEVGDMCEWNTASQQRDVAGTYMVQRIWSNKAALAGHDPCVPALDTPYFNASPSIGNVSLTTRNGAIMVQGITVPLDGSTDVTFDLFSDAPVASDWDVALFDAASLFTTGTPASFEFQYGRVASGNNGQTMTVSVLRKAAASSHGNLIFVEARPVDDATQIPAYWWIFAQ